MPFARLFRAERLRSLSMLLVLVAAGCLLLTVATVPLTPREQSVLAIAGVAIFLVANRFRQPGVTLFLITLSLAISSRYVFWRVTETLSFDTPIEALFGIGLALAELYAVIVLVLGYIQTASPLERAPLPLPADPDTWPTVDVYIPTYNESLSIVRSTTLACMAIDWPADKLRVYILDDGKREEFRAFAEAAGCGYVTRNNNRHAKAGNLNEAMKVTQGEFIAIFDCDHIPTCAFLQMTLGWLVAQPKLALVQTPHHFYSPDPFQRNLASGTRVPAEGNLFYGLLQPGNDYWDATFFCGSCAVLRRTALAEVGGIATETVTEDAHTMLKLHRRGWSSAYLRLPLASGLATERLMSHIGQRVRWARGMIQILRVDCPLFGPGLRLPQRLCYVQAMLHFLFALPRIVFLTSPLAYLLLFQNIFAASPLAIVAYGIPHVFHAVATNSRIQKNWRHSFWSEIYETVLALYLVRVAIATVWDPRHGKFNVTSKGGLLENGYFDLRAVYPNIIMCALLIAGILRGIYTMTFTTTDALTFQALLLNSIWAGISTLIVLAALAVGREAKQLRSSHRVRAALPVTVYLPDGRLLTGVTRDLSEGGLSIDVKRPADVGSERAKGAELAVEFTIANRPMVLPARGLRWEQDMMQAKFEPKTIAEESEIVQVVFGRADAWLSWADYPNDRPLSALWQVLVSIRGLFRPAEKSEAPPREAPALAGPAQGNAAPVAVGLRTAAMLGLFMLAPVVAWAQQPGTVTSVRPIPQSVDDLPNITANTPATAIVAPTANPTTPAAGPAISAAVAAPASAASDQNTRHVVLTLRALGAQGPLTLRGTSELGGVQFGVRNDEVVTAAELTLSGATSPALIPQSSNITLTLNEQYVGTIPVTPDRPSFSNLVMPVDPVFFQDNNRLNFRLTGRYTTDCNDPMSGLLWSTVSDNSTLALTLQRLPAQRDLARLPLPLFDEHEKTQLTLPFILDANPSTDALRAAGIVASWFGQKADYRGARFPVIDPAGVEGNAVTVIAGNAPPELGLPPITGPTLAVVPNPSDPYSSLLVVAGRTGAEVVTAASALAASNATLAGSSASVEMPDLPARAPYDAPNWIPTNRPVKLGELAMQSELQVTGYVGTVRVPFRTAPDLYTWFGRTFPLDIGFHAPPGPIIDLGPSRLDVGINGAYLHSFSLGGVAMQNGLLSRVANAFGIRAGGQVRVPPYDVFGRNDLQLFFDARPLHRGECVAVPGDIKMGIDPNSTIDLSRAYHFAPMPNLAFFVNAGFPFTRLADLSGTAVILPDRPTSLELGTFLDLMGQMGALTGYPVFGVTVGHPDQLDAVGDRDILLVGTIERLGTAASLLENADVHIEGRDRLSMALPGALDGLRRLVLAGPADEERDRLATRLTATLPADGAVLVGMESPLHSGRSVVALLGATPKALSDAITALHDSARAPSVQGSLSLFSGGKVTAYRLGVSYTVGHLPFWVWPSWWLGDQPLGLVGLMVAGCALMGFALLRLLRRRSTARLQQHKGAS